MAYTPSNVNIYYAALAGAASGLGASGRAPTDALSTDPSVVMVARIAESFAESYDTQWGIIIGTTADAYQVAATQEICEAVWEERGIPTGTFSFLPSSYTVLCKGLIALVEAGETAAYAAGAPPSPPAAGSGGGVILKPYAMRPSPSANPDSLFICSDPGIVNFVSDGTAWRPLVGPNGGTIGTESAPGNSTAAYTAINSAVKAASVGVLEVSHVNAGVNLIAGAEVPRTAGQSVTASVQFGMGSTVVTNAQIIGGVYVRDSTSDQCYSIGCDYLTGAAGLTKLLLLASLWSNSTTYGSDIQNSTSWENMPQVPISYQITDDGTNIHFNFSWDNVTFFSLAAIAPTGGPAAYDRAGVFVSPTSAAGFLKALSFLVH